MSCIERRRQYQNVYYYSTLAIAKGKHCSSCFVLCAICVFLERLERIRSTEDFCELISVIIIIILIHLSGAESCVLDVSSLRCNMCLLQLYV